MSEVIRNRRQTWYDERRIKMLLSDVQKLVRLCYVLDLPAEEFASLIYFTLDQFPVVEGSLKDGNVTDEWSEFEDGIPKYSIDEFYARVMRPCNDNSEIGGIKE